MAILGSLCHKYTQNPEPLDEIKHLAKHRYKLKEGDPSKFKDM